MYAKQMRWEIKPPCDGITVPKITGIRQLLLKLTLEIGWYTFFATQCTYQG